MRETVVVQVGQAGNQIGGQLWTEFLKEHESARFRSDAEASDALSAFFRISRKGGKDTLKARALLVDMECGPLQETMRGPLGALFDDTQFVMDVYGAGNNFAHGHCEYGPQYRDKFEESLRKIVEHCDSLQNFIVTHSLGGGTGSGVGTYLVGLLHDLYPEVYRFSTCVFPSEDDDVVTSPYNSTLACRELIEHADCVLPIDNHALQSFADLEAAQLIKKKEQKGSQVKEKNKNDKGFDAMNGVAARMLCHLTASSRFHGEMNVDMNEISTNLIPFPRMNFLMTALSPQRALQGGALSFKFNSNTASPTSTALKGGLQRAFADVISRTGQLTAADPSAPGSITISSAFLSRGNVRLSDFLSCVNSAQGSTLHFPPWNEDACKIGMCGTPSPGEDMSVLAVYNSSSFGSVLSRIRSRFNTLFKRKAMLHHYTNFLDVSYLISIHTIIIYHNYILI